MKSRHGLVRTGGTAGPKTDRLPANSCFERRAGNLNENGSRHPENETPTPVPTVQDPVEGAARVLAKTDRLDDLSFRPDVRLEDPRETLGSGHGRLLLPLNTQPTVRMLLPSRRRRIVLIRFLTKSHQSLKPKRL